jgi:hypothetical protein
MKISSGDRSMAPDSRAAAFLLTSVLASLATIPVARAQDDSIESSPLNITSQSTFGAGPDCKGQSGFLVQFHYTGAQPLRGYLVRLILTGSSTPKVLQEQTVEEIRKSNEPMIADGAEWTRNVCSFGKKLSGDGTTVTAKVDVLKFADGSIWGPLDLRESHQLVGRLDGIDFMGKETELERFVTPILPEQGPLPAENVRSELLGPLRVESGLWRDDSGQAMLAVEITNEGKKPIRGYLLTTSFFDPNNGALIRRFSTKELETHGDPDHYLTPGSAWIADPRKYSYLPDGTPANYKITLDMVAFADGSIFGPRKSQESDEVLGIIEGIDEAKHMSEEASAKKER